MEWYLAFGFAIFLTVSVGFFAVFSGITLAEGGRLAAVLIFIFAVLIAYGAGLFLEQNWYINGYFFMATPNSFGAIAGLLWRYPDTV